MRLVISLFLGAWITQAAASPQNVLLICIDDLRPELRCFGADYIHSPHIDKLAEGARIFSRHYVQAPTCGASRFTLLTGRYGRKNRSNGALFARAKEWKEPPAIPSMPRHFRDHGYTTVSVGKISHHPGGRGGADWDNDTIIEMPGAWTRHLQPTGPWQHPRGIMHGLAHGEIRKRAGDMAIYQAAEGDDSIYPDGLITDTALHELKTLTEDDAPFFLAVGIIRPHLPFGAPKRYFDLYQDTELPPIPHPSKPEGKTTWHRSGEFMKYQRWGKDPNKDTDFATEVRRHYAACVSYADAQVGRLIEALKKSGKMDDTVIVVWGDHGWHLGEHAIWGKHALFEESLRSPLVIHHSKVEQPGKTSDAVVETLDLFPTLCELANLPTPENLDGKTLMPHLREASSDGEFAISYTGSARTIRTPDHRLIAHRNGHLELYDHNAPQGETRNLAEERPELAASLLTKLNEHFAP